MVLRFAGNPEPPENFVESDISPDRLDIEQRNPVSPDPDWPEAPEGSKNQIPGRSNG